MVKICILSIPLDFIISYNSGSIIEQPQESSRRPITICLVEEDSVEMMSSELTGGKRQGLD